MSMSKNLILYVDSELILADLLKWNFPMQYRMHYDVALSGMVYFRAHGWKFGLFSIW